MKDTSENIYPIQVARAAMALKGLSVRDIADRTDVQTTNIETFLRGYTEAISAESSNIIFNTLGFDSSGLALNRVHFFNISIGRPGKNKRALMPITTILPLIGTHEAMALKRVNGMTPVLIKSDAGHRIVILVKASRFHRVTPADLGLTAGTFDGTKTVESITDYYYQLLFSNNLKPKYFDLILNGDFRSESVELLRMVALEYDLPITEIIAGIIKADEPPKTIEAETQKHESNIYVLIDRKAGNM